MQVTETERLVLQHLQPDDAAFILMLLNTPSWRRFIGDRGIRTEAQARQYIIAKLMKSYESPGFGFYLTKLKEGDVSIGICGIVKRESLEDVDIGFAFLPEYEGKGYGYESAAAVLKYAKEKFNLDRIAAITNKDNERSIRLLQKLGLRFEKMILLPNETEEIMFFVHPGINED
ncbi:MAG TPA: GNAT family N-acetyltransferase [Bacteroidia bacterium]|jgi:RimJ/RimL family protein N-acetyltransferase